MKNSFLLSTTISALALFSITEQSARANIDILVRQTSGGVVFSYSGSLRVSELTGPSFNFTPSGRVWPSWPWMEFAPASNAVTNGMSYYSSAVASAPSNFGSGGSSSPTTFAGDYFGIDYFDVTVPNGYTDDALISGVMAFDGATFTSMGLTSTSGAPYSWILDNGETVTLRIDSGPSTVLLKNSLEKKLKKLKTKLKSAKRRKQKGKTKKLKKQIKELKSKIRAL